MPRLSTFLAHSLAVIILLASQAGNASLEVDGVWAAGVWEPTVWEEGVWREGEPPPTLWDLTGIPSGWTSMPNVLTDKEFVAIMRQEANGDGVWAYWLPGTINASANLKLNMENVLEEANTNAVWARWAPGAPRNSANLQINLQAALNADFVVTP